MPLLQDLGGAGRPLYASSSGPGRRREESSPRCVLLPGPRRGLIASLCTSPRAQEEESSPRGVGVPGCGRVRCTRVLCGVLHTTRVHTARPRLLLLFLCRRIVPRRRYAKQVIPDHLLLCPPPMASSSCCRRRRRLREMSQDRGERDYNEAMTPHPGTRRVP